MTAVRYGATIDWPGSDGVAPEKTCPGLVSRNNAFKAFRLLASDIAISVGTW